MIDEDVAPFVTQYLARLAAIVDHVDHQALADVCGMVRDTIESGGQVCAVGNGGSSAITRGVSFQLRCQAGAVSPRVRVLDVGDQHEIAHWASASGYASALAEMLWRRGLRRDDTVIAVSMSGRSPNVVALARECEQRGVRVVGFTGGEGGALAEVASRCVRTGNDDQQISEDAVLIWLTLAVNAMTAGDCGLQALSVAAGRAAGRIGQIARHTRLPEFLGELSAEITRGMRTGRTVAVMSGQGGPLGWACEHIAHNLHWDVPTGTAVRTPAVLDAASVADATAIYNDHPDPSYGLRYGMARLATGDVVCGIAYADGTPPLRDVLVDAGARGVAAYLITTAPTVPEWPAVLSVNAVDVWELSTMTQPIGHMLCRLTTQRLRDAARGHRGSALPELLAVDLAPGRAHRAAGAVA